MFGTVATHCYNYYAMWDVIHHHSMFSRPICSYICVFVFKNTLPKISLATLDGLIVNPEIATESEMCDALKVHGAQTKHLQYFPHQMYKWDFLWNLDEETSTQISLDVLSSWRTKLQSICSPLKYVLSNDSTRNEFKEKKLRDVISRPMWHNRRRLTRSC